MEPGMKVMFNKKALLESLQKDSQGCTLQFSLWKDVDGKLQYEKELTCFLTYSQLLAIACRFASANSGSAQGSGF